MNKKICSQCEYYRDPQVRQAVLLDHEMNYPGVIKASKEYRHSLEVKIEVEKLEVSNLEMEGLTYYDQEPVTTAWCAYYTEKYKDDCSVDCITGIRQQSFYLCKFYNANGDCEAFSVKSKKTLKKCEECKHFRSNNKSSDLDIPIEDFDIWREITESRHEYRELEALEKLSMLKRNEQKWSFKPEYSSYCGISEDNKIYLAQELKNFFCDCKDFE